MVTPNHLKFSTAIMFLCFYAFPTLAQVYDLRPKYTKGQELTFSETQTITVSSDYLPGSDQNYVLKSVLTQKVDHVFEDGSVLLTLTFKRSQIEGQTPPPQRMDYSLLVGYPISVLLDSQFRTKKITPPDNLPEAAENDFSRFKQLYYNLSPDSQTPNRLIAMGETWDNTQTLSYEFMTAVFDQIQKLRSTLKKETLYMGRPGLLIDFEGDFSGSITEGMNGTISGSFKGSRTMEKETGQDIHVELTMEQSMNFMTDQGDLNYKIKVYLVRQVTNEDPLSIQ